MKRPAQFLLAAYLATIVAGFASEVTIAAESGAVAQDLLKVKESGMVTASSWTRAPDSYALQVVLDRSAYSAKQKAIRETRNAANEQSAATIAESLQKLMPQNISAYQPTMVGDAQAAGGGGKETIDRSSFFIGATIANLRGLNPTFGCRALSLIDGRRVVAGQQPVPPPVPVQVAQIQSYPPRVREQRVEVWLLKADGTLIQPATYSCDPGSGQSGNNYPVISYGFSVAAGAQAVAAAIRIDDDYYIEKLRPLQGQ